MFLVLLLVSCASTPERPAILQEKFWKNYKEIPLESKIQDAPPELIKYLLKANEKGGWPNKPRAVDMPADLLKDVRNAINELPRALKEKITSKVAGIIFVDDLGGSALTEVIYNTEGKRTAAVVVLDKSMLNRKANEWATWKESTPFKDNQKIKLQIRIENPQNNNRKNALQYILLHEFGHVLNIGSDLLPFWEDRPQDFKDQDIPFFRQSWQVSKKDEIESIYDKDWPERKDVRFYTGDEKKIAMDKLLELYSRLSQTSFPTLYATTDYSDDFADAFANYVHVVVLDKPWIIELNYNNEKYSFGDCWNEDRCEGKKKLLEQLVR